MAVILGIDPGLNHTGYGIVTAAGGVIALLEAGTIEGGKETIAAPAPASNPTPGDGVALDGVSASSRGYRTAVLSLRTPQNGDPHGTCSRSAVLSGCRRFHPGFRLRSH